MALVNSNDLLKKARESRVKYAVPAFNIINFNTARAAIAAARIKNSPLIIQTSQAVIEYYGFKPIASWINSLINDTDSNNDIPVVLHLDHGTKMQVVKGCIENGWSSVMIDASKFSFEENIRITKEVVDMAHSVAAHLRKLSVEGELGHIGGVEDHINIDIDKARLTGPNEVVEFFERTNVDSLAVAIGTAHGKYEGATGPKLDFERLAEINAVTPKPIVLHGCSDIPRDKIEKLIQNGASKINVSTEVKIRYADALFEYLVSHREEYNPIKLIDNTHQRLMDLFCTLIDWCGSENKA